MKTNSYARDLAKAGALKNFKACADSFALDTTGSSWERMEQAMWALQGANELPDIALNNITLGGLIEGLARKHKG